MPSFLTDNRLRIILGCGCLLLGIVNAIFYYRDLALAAQTKTEVIEVKKRPVTQVTASPVLETAATGVPAATATPLPSPSASPKPTATPKASAAPQAKATTTAVSGKVKISAATEAEFDSLPGIGPSKAKAIVEYRATKPFTKLEDLKEVTGIGDKTYESLLPYIEL